MAITKPFEEHTRQYEQWFEKNEFAYQSELAAVRMLLPKEGTGIEIGVGSGRFAVPLGIRRGIEPAANMRAIAEHRGVLVDNGSAECLPYADANYDFVLLVTTICFLDDLDAAFREIYRVLSPAGCVVIGFVDKESSLGRLYEKYRENSVFYRHATFYSVDEVTEHLERNSFGGCEYNQTVFTMPDMMHAVEPVKQGYGEGSFVVIRARKKGAVRDHEL
ncbi:MAG: class I SAM-dependent methyltransferase [Spirochaetales bacterium]|nr:class I SAM-dependent methyltransferase [Spirochaetales bacterium]